MRSARVLLITVGICTIRAQSPTGPRFEVASVRENHSGAVESDVRITPAGLRLRNTSLRQCIAKAYSLEDYQIVAPSWLETAMYDISAKAPAGAFDEDLPMMLRALLVERFHISTHTEIRNVKGFDLVMSATGLKMKSVAAPTDGLLRTTRRHLIGSSVTMAQLAKRLGQLLECPVTDKTAADGHFTIDLHFAPIRVTRGVGSDIDDPSLTTAVRSLGLALKQKRIDVSVLFIDHIERLSEADQD
jgi:bla regulator protein BlaR1